MKTEKDHLTEVLSKTYTMQGPDEPVWIEGLGVLTRRLMKDAADGKIGAMKTLFARVDANGIGREDETDSLTKADDQVLDQYIELFRASQKD